MHHITFVSSPISLPLEKFLASQASSDVGLVQSVCMNEWSLPAIGILVDIWLDLDLLPQVEIFALILEAKFLKDNGHLPWIRALRFCIRSRDKRSLSAFLQPRESKVRLALT